MGKEQTHNTEWYKKAYREVVERHGIEVDRYTTEISRLRKQRDEVVEELAKQCDATMEAIKQIEKLQKELEGYRRYKENIDQALNTGDGVYRP